MWGVSRSVTAAAGEPMAAAASWRRKSRHASAAGRDSDLQQRRTVAASGRQRGQAAVVRRRVALAALSVSCQFLLAIRRPASHSPVFQCVWAPQGVGKVKTQCERASLGQCSCRVALIPMLNACVRRNECN